ncbi:MAG: 23S rRNA (pseudouridine(1915)-N(3))-methyltransferase RlmH [Coxiellaceae bacterium]|nr:23S rRNA (pseudouridine(1915)-N(3))-methyltransferase RlmH [Coxiellaceae bacterium]
MKIYIIAIGQRMPAWVDSAFEDYQKRLPSDYELILKTIAAEKRHKTSNTDVLIEKESVALLSQCPPNTYKIALDRQGKFVDTQQIATALQGWHDDSQDIALLIGGPEGISNAILKKCDLIWSLSKLTLPHPLVRVLVAEQMFRAFSILSHHPYHR